MSGMRVNRGWLAFALAGFTLMGGAPVAAQSETGGTDAWQVNCPENSACVAIQESDLATVLAGPGGSDGELRITLLVAAEAGEGTPVGVRLPDVGTIQFRTRNCTENFCQAPAALDTVADVRTAFEAASRAMVAYPADGRVVFASVPLEGFGAAVAEAEGG